MGRLNAMSAIVLLSVTASASTGLSNQASLHEGVTRTVFVSVVDRSGVPVTDLSADDFVIKEGGKDREIVGANMTTMPLRIAIVVDDNGTGIFRYALGKFVERLQGRAEFALSTVQGQHLRLLDYTTNLERLLAAINQLNARPATNDGGQLLEGIFETAKDFQKRRTARPIIVVLTVGGEEHSTLPAQHVLDELEKSGAALNVIAINSSALRAMVTVSKPSALLESNLNLSEVLGDGPKQSGGKRDEIVASPGIVTGLQELAEALRNQYAVSFSRADRPKETEKLSVSVKRSGLTVRAPTKVRLAN
ncbi:MAG TPA: VWA domain-containing protein [Vicinamibacterales bacterium]|jgi:VWFA-related protein|nr:VWA domain-containing protein [Vicinamibacterales bacterium]